ncbi:MAG: circadian clock protein KaiC [Herpetosiphonaceae bacterium]|nr:MAG: circadian clock protein KaiC [Herpetosiphonaceae bacterium]
MEGRKTERFSTGDIGLDQILQGGLLKHGIHVVTGLPGTGKTILTQQIGFHIASKGHQVVTVTALAESHERLLSHLESFEFFDPALVGSKVYYLSASRLFIEQGLLPSLHDLRQLISSPRADVLIFEGLSAVGKLAATEIDFRRFLFELNTHLMLMSCMGLFVADSDPDNSISGPEYTLTDTVIMMHRQTQAQRHIREIEVLKSRGTGAVTGQHLFEIASRGVMVYPRLEAFKDHTPTLWGDVSKKTGLAEVDQLLAGGLPKGSMTMLLGEPGTGKTLLGLNFIVEGGRQGEPGLVWSFQQPGEGLIKQAAGVGLELDQLVDQGLVTIHWQPPLELLIDKEFYLLQRTIEERGIQRLLIDPFNPISILAEEMGRMPELLAALSSRLRSRGVTSIITVELANLLNLYGAPSGIPPFGAADNKLLLRYEARADQLIRTITVLKKRVGGHSLAIREYDITDKGFQLHKRGSPPAEGQ